MRGERHQNRDCSDSTPQLLRRRRELPPRLSTWSTLARTYDLERANREMASSLPVTPLEQAATFGTCAGCCEVDMDVVAVVVVAVSRRKRLNMFPPPCPSTSPVADRLDRGSPVRLEAAGVADADMAGKKDWWRCRRRGTVAMETSSSGVAPGNMSVVGVVGADLAGADLPANRRELRSWCFSPLK